MAKPAMGFSSSKRTGDDLEAINRMFTPEFRNRLDAVVPFAGLPPEVITKVVEKFIFQLEAQLADRGVNRWRRLQKLPDPYRLAQTRPAIRQSQQSNYSAKIDVSWPIVRSQIAKYRCTRCKIMNLSGG